MVKRIVAAALPALFVGAGGCPGLLSDDNTSDAAPRTRTIQLSSNNAFTASTIDGTLEGQLEAINAGDISEPFVGLVLVDDDYCGGPCEEIDGAREVSLNNLDSASYRFTFTLPARFSNARIEGRAVLDDQGVAFLNGERISGQITADSWGSDSTDEDGLARLTWPTVDAFSHSVNSTFRPGVNVLIFAVCGDCSIEPTGLAFEATVAYELP